MKMRKVLIGYALLYVVLMALMLWAQSADANEPEVGYTCQEWYVSWQADKADLRTMIKQGIVDVVDDLPGLEEWRLCMLMNVDYLINTTLQGCDAGEPLNMAGPLVLKKLSVRCAT